MGEGLQANRVTMTMQAAVKEQAREATQTTQMVVTVEVVAYIVLIALSLVLRIAELDTIPLSDTEARQALASWQVIHPAAAGTSIVPESPILFLLNNLSFTVMGGSEMSARLLTALGGVLLGLSPMLFRRLFGQTRTFVFSLLLTLSPVSLIAARSGSPVVWTMMFAIAGLWGLWRYWEAQRPFHGLLATTMLLATALLAESGGPVLTIILLISGAAALLLTAWDAPNKADTPSNEFLATIRARLAGWPWQNGLLFGVLMVVVVGTAFMFYPAGISAVGNLLGAALSGIVTRQPATTGAFPLVITLFYEPFLIVFALVSVWLIARRAAFNFLERFFLVWAATAGVMAILYAGGEAAHALWLIIPLAGLASYTGTALLADDDNTGLWGVRLSDMQFAWQPIPRWGKWLLAAATIALLMICTIHLQMAGRTFMTMNIPEGYTLGDTIGLLFEPQYLLLRTNLVLIVFGAVFIVMGHLLAASVWGNMTAVQGGALGILIFGLVTSLGSGWNAAVTNASDPAELWHFEATDPGAFLLRDTLNDLAKRESDGFPLMPVTVVVDAEGIIREDGVIAWALRDFPKTAFVGAVEDAQTDGVVLIRAPMRPEEETPPLGGNYVGQSFAISRSWDDRTLHPADVIVWWTQRQTRIPASPDKAIVLWVRQDIYNGVEPDNTPQ